MKTSRQPSFLLILLHNFTLLVVMFCSNINPCLFYLLPHYYKDVDIKVDINNAVNPFHFLPHIKTIFGGVTERLSTPKPIVKSFVFGWKFFIFSAQKMQNFLFSSPRFFVTLMAFGLHDFTISLLVHHMG